MIETPFNFTGSKFKLLEQILPYFDYTKTNFIDLFCGGGSVYTNVLDKYNYVIINDIITELIGIHKGIMESDDIIYNTIKLCPKKDEPGSFLELRKNFNKEKTPERLQALMLCSTNNFMRFNNKFEYNSTHGKRTQNNNTELKVSRFKEHIRQYKGNVIYNSKHFSEIEIAKNSMVYIDPPYGRIKENGGIGKKQISEAGYNCYQKLDDDKLLFDYIMNINDNKESFMVSGVQEHDGKVCWLIDELINLGFNYKELNFNYNRVSKVGDKKTTEVIIFNY